MTIYALVNDLMDPSSLTDGTAPLWTLISPAAILQGGNPYFVPDFAARFEARAAMAIRIGKLGKGVAPRFASRYVEAIAPAALFIAADRLETLRKEGAPWTSGLSYDRSLAIGRFRNVPFEEISTGRCALRLDGLGKETVTKAATNADIGKVLECISRDNTLKTGDIILVGIASAGPQLHPDMKAALLLDGEENLRFNIR